MNLLKTKTLPVGGVMMTISEYTALDRLQDLEHSLGFPVPDHPAAEEGEQALVSHQVAMEVRNLDMASYSLALSLKHGNECYQSLPVKEVQTILKEQWPNSALNAAYALLLELNQPPQSDDDDTPADDDITPEKR